MIVWWDMTDIDIRKLSALSRVAVTDEEVAALEREIPDILAFVDQIADAGGEAGHYIGDNYNVLREDAHPHETGVYTQELVDAMPSKTDDNYLRVRKIIAQD